MSETLFERLGGVDAVTQLAHDVVQNHWDNPVIAKRFGAFDLDKLKKGAADFFITGTGGPSVYQGKDMIATHKGMNINNDEFMAVLEDAMGAMEKNNVGQREKEEVLYIFFSLRNEVLRQ